MSKHDFELAEFETRQRRVREAMEKAGIDLMLVTHPVNINYLIGARHKGYLVFQCLFFTLEPGPLTIMTKLADAWEVEEQSLAEDVRGWGGREPENPIDAFKAIMEEKGFLGRRIGLEVPRFYMSGPEYVGVKEVLGDALVMDGSLLIEELKFAKSPAEIAYIRKAVAIADAAMRTMVDVTREGMTELEIAGEMHRTMMRLGSDAAASPMNLSTGPRTAYGHGMPTDRKLEPGDDINTEYGASYKRYTTTIGRQLCLGKPTARMREIYAIQLEACDACIAAARAGVPAVVPHEATKKVLTDAGMDRYRLHITGYGIAPGFPPSWQESVHMFGGSPYTLEAGMVLSVEPPIFIPEEGIGARVVDNILIKEDGAEILSTFTRDLIEL
jgi:Xaa-Pro dipeptidase